ncbi:hypothetical protein BJ912DRAFT_966036 [Pholiota molesta]|nr:hypothetical protein BJ912DRAFT_966036 [Pholiota molesta]
MTASSSFVANRIETCKLEDDHQLLKNIAGTAYAAGADTTTSSVTLGTTIIPNAWAMTRNPLKYENPQEFDPDRFFDKNNELDNRGGQSG